MTGELPSLKTEERETDCSWCFLFEEHPCPTWIYDLDTLGFMAVNQAAVEQYGYTREEFLRMTLSDIRPTEDVQKLLCNVESEQATAQDSGAWRHSRKDGSVVHVRIISRAIRHHGRRARLVVVHEIEKQIAAERALDRSERLRQIVWEHAAGPMRVTDGDGTVITVNAAYERFAGLLRSEIEGRPFWIIYPEIDQPRIAALYKERFKKRLLESVAERRVTLDDGRTVWLELTSSYVHDERGTVLLTILRDVTESRKAMEELGRAKQQADAANLAKTTFLANMSHEIRTPMNGVMGMISLVLETCQDPEERDQLLMAQKAARSLITILNDILDLSKIEAGRVTLESVDFDLKESFQDALRIFDPACREKNLDLRLAFAQDCPRWVQGDPVRMRQVVVNLVGNAVKFTLSGGVHISVNQEQPEMIRIDVRDTGIGIPQEKLSSIFDAFT